MDTNQEYTGNEVWLFNGGRNPYPSAVFSSFETANMWIVKNALTGLLTKYPVDIGVYQWAVMTNRFKPKRPWAITPEFIGSFSHATQEHYHFEDGKNLEFEYTKDIVSKKAKAYTEVWVFTGNTGMFSSGVFSALETAEAWIKEYSLNGTLVKYPIDISSYDWAIANGFFEPRGEDELSAKFIEIFNSASQTHYEYKDGGPT